MSFLVPDERGAVSGSTAKDIRKLTNFDRSDTDRTKMLKEVLKSAAKSAAAEEGETLHTPTLRHASKQVSDKSFFSSKRRSVSPRVSDVSQQPFLLEGEVSQLQSSVMEDSCCVDIFAEDDYDGHVDDLAPVLRFSSARIGGLCARLQTPEVQAMRESPPSRALGGSGVSVSIVPRPEKKGAAQCEARRALRNAIRSGGAGALRALDGVALAAEEAPVVERSRAEEAAAKFINDHSRFDQLEELSERIDKNLSYQDLRGAFPQRVHHHPALLVLADSLLADPAMFSQSIAQARRNEPFFVKTSAPFVGAKHSTRVRQLGTDRHPAPVVTASIPVPNDRERPQTTPTPSGAKTWPRTAHVPRAFDVHRAASSQGIRRRFQGLHLTPGDCGSKASQSKTPPTPARSHSAGALEQLGPVTPQAATRGRMFGSISSTALLGGTL